MMRSVVGPRSTAASSLVALCATSASGQTRTSWMRPGATTANNKGLKNDAYYRSKRQAERNKQLKEEVAQEEELHRLEKERLSAREVRTQEPYFAKGAYSPKQPVNADKDPQDPPGFSDSVRMREFNTAFGRYETVPPDTHGGGIPLQRAEKFQRDPPDNMTHMSRITGLAPVVEGHHPFYDYTSDSGLKEGINTRMNQAHITWDEKVSIHSLYRQCIRSLPLIKHFYYFLTPLDTMKRRIRDRFEANRHVQDREAIRQLLHMGWMDYTESVTFRKTKQAVAKHFEDDESKFDMLKHYTNEEGKQIEERRIHAGGYQGKEGPYDGFWSTAGKQAHEEFEKLEGRIPVSYTASKGYFEVWKPDGTHFWEKNMDYEGWYVKNVDPDRASARKEVAAWIEAGYNQPRHYASKNRRSYRRFVRDVDAMMNMTSHEMYAATRETMFHSWVRECAPESNRLAAEKKLALNDDNVFTMKFDEHDLAFRQAVREFPNPRLWKTDAFFLRMRQLTANLEYNWAKAPVGVALELAYNEWISSDVNYAIINSAKFAEVKADKTRNPMAKSWADFYTEFDPDQPETRRLPWYHADFDYDRRYFWDEKCMRMKKWVQSGDIDFRNDFFQKEVAQWEQLVNRPELFRKPEAVEYRYTAPRMVQLYRSLGKRMDMALANQMKEYLVAKNSGLNKDAILNSHGSESSTADIEAALAKCDFADFKFDVPPVIYPDNYQQPALETDGRPRQIEATN